MPDVVLVVDVANVMGSRPDGWWRDRAGAASRLVADLATLVGSEVVGPDGESLTLARVVAVLEGKACGAVLAPPVPAGLIVVRAPASGDDEIVAQAQAQAQAQASGGAARVLVATADRGLQARLPRGCRPVGPGWLLTLLGR